MRKVISYIIGGVTCLVVHIYINGGFATSLPKCDNIHVKSLIVQSVKKYADLDVIDVNQVVEVAHNEKCGMRMCTAMLVYPSHGFDEGGGV